MIRKILFSLFVFTSLNLIAQKQEFVGIGINSEMMRESIMKTGIAFSYENQLSKHNGFEIDLNQRSRDLNFTVKFSDGSTQTSHINEDYLTLPILYKFYSDFVNVSTGITFDYFVGWKDLTKIGSAELISYSANSKFQVGWAFRVSKFIPLSSKFVLEPEIHINPIFFGYYSAYYGAGVKLKYKL